MEAEHVWALIGVLCIITLFAMMLLGIRNVKDESFSDSTAEELA